MGKRNCICKWHSQGRPKKEIFEHNPKGVRGHAMKSFDGRAFQEKKTASANALLCLRKNNEQRESEAHGNGFLA